METTLNNILPYSPEWYAARLGKFTSSEIYKLMADLTGPETKAGYTIGKAARTYVWECITEILTGQAEPEGFISADMKWGTDHEREAMICYVNKTGRETAMGVFIVHSDRLCGTPDGVDEDRVSDIKCPKSSTHLQYRLINSPVELKDKHPNNYWQLVCNGYLAKKEKATFISYDPRFKDEKLWLKVLDFDIPEEDTRFLKVKIDLTTTYLNEQLAKIQAS